MYDFTNGKLDEAKKYAASLAPKIGRTLQICLDSLQQVEENYNKQGRPTMTKIYADFAPLSFYFVRMHPATGHIYGNGGIIFHGQHDGGGNGSAPTFSINLTPSNGWEIHT